MREVVIRANIPGELEHLKDRIEEIVNRGIIRQLVVLRKTRKCLKTKKTWEELEVKMYDELYEDLIGLG